MSGFDSNNVLDRWGRKGQTVTNTDSVGLYGKVGANQGDSQHVDIYGNLGPITAAFIGYLNLAGYTTDHTSRVKWSSSGQTLQVPTAAQIANLMVIMGSIPGTEIIATGSIITTGHFFIGGPGRTINTQSPPGTQTGGGTVTLVDPQNTGVNGVTSFGIDTGATLKLGTDWTKQHGYFYGSGAAQLANGGTLEIRSSSYFSGDQQNGGNTASTGIMRYIGNPATGNTYWRGVGLANSGLIEIQDCALAIGGVSGTGTIRVKNNSSLVQKQGGIPTGQTLKISGNGVSPQQLNFRGIANLPYPQAAFAVEYGLNTYAAGIELEADATIAYAAFWEPGNIYNSLPAITSTIDKVLTIGCPPINSGSVYTNYGDDGTVSFYSVNPNLLGGVKVAYGNLRLTGANTIQNAAYLELINNGTVTLATAQSIKSLRSNSSTNSISVAGGALTLTAQESTPVKSNFTSIQPVNINGGSLILDRASISLTGAFVVGTGAKFGTTQSTTLAGALTMSGATSTLVVDNTTSRITTPTFNATSGFRVDLPNVMTAGTYTILTATAGNKPVPTLGINNSGLTPTFAWSGNNLTVSLA